MPQSDISQLTEKIAGVVREKQAGLISQLLGEPHQEREPFKGPTWADVSKKLDPNMKQGDYDNLRLRYFMDVVKPRIRPGFDMQATYEDFLQKTERPKVLSPFERGLVRAGLFSTAAVKAMIPGAAVGEQETLLRGMAERDGISTSFPEGAGQFLGAGLGMAPFFGPAGSLSKALVSSFTNRAKVIDIAAKIGRGGLAVGAYDALHAEDGDRVAAGLRGAMWGSLAEAGFGAVFGFSERAGGKAIQKAVNEKIAEKIPSAAPVDEWEAALGKVEPFDVAAAEMRQRSRTAEGAVMQQMEMPSVGAAPGLGLRPGVEDLNRAVANGLQNTVVEARAKGYTMGMIRENPSANGLTAKIRDAQGNISTLNVPRGKESETIGKLEELLSQGGAIDEIITSTKSKARAGELVRHFAARAEAEETTLRMATPKGKAGKVARELNGMGLMGRVVDDSTVLVGPEAGWVKGQRAKKMRAAAADFVANGGKAPEMADEAASNLFRQGEIRTFLQENPGKAGNGELFAELHHLQGDLSVPTRIENRADIGQIGLNYFERTVSGEKVDAAAELAKYKGPRMPEGQRAPEGNQNPSGILGKDYRLSEPTTAESMEFSSTEAELAAAPGELRVRPTGTTKILEADSKKAGVLGGVIAGPEGPIRVLARDALNRKALYHEDLHVGSVFADVHNRYLELAGTNRATLGMIGKGLARENPWNYGRMNPATLANEAFTHLSEAFRNQDHEMLRKYVEWDTSIEHLKGFINETAGNAYVASMTRDTAPVRAFQRRMVDLVRRTSPMRSEALGQAQMHGYTTWFNPEIKQWVMRDGEGREFLKATYDDVWNHIEQADPSSHFPDIAHPAYFKGIPGPIIPPGMEPTGATATLESDRIPLGFQGLNSIWRPTLDWAASVQRKLDKYKVPMDFYGKVNDVIEAGRRAGPVMDSLWTDFASVFKGTPGGRRLDYGEVLARDPSEWSAMEASLSLSSKDMANIRHLADWDQRNVASGGVSLVDTLKTLRAVREVGGDIERLGIPKSSATEAIRHGSLSYSDLNVGAVGRWTIRKTIDQKYMSEPLNALEQLAATRGRSGEPILGDIHYPVRNLINNMRGIPDASQELLNGWVNSMTGFANKRIVELNKGLPQEWQITPFGAPKQLMAKYQLALYASGLGARPAVFIRDTFQSMYAFTILGPKAFAEGMSLAMTRAGHAEAKTAGALLQGRRVGEFFGDITGDLPSSSRVSDAAVKFADTLLAPSRMGDNIGRSIAYLAEKSRAMREIQAFRDGLIKDPSELANRTGVWFQDEAPRMRLLGIAADKSIPLEEAARQFGLAMNDATQFPMRSGTQAAVLRTGMGRILGQYGTWPSNYAEFVRKLAWRTMDNPRKAVPALGMWMGINYGAFQAAKEMGIDAGKWLWASPAGYAGSPNLELLQNIMAAPEESPAGYEARRKLHDFPMQMVPAGVQINNILKALEEDDLSLVRVLGFRPLKDQRDLEFDEWLARETGFPKPE